MPRVLSLGSYSKDEQWQLLHLSGFSKSICQAPRRHAMWTGFALTVMFLFGPYHQDILGLARFNLFLTSQDFLSLLFFFNVPPTLRLRFFSPCFAPKKSLSSRKKTSTRSIGENLLAFPLAFKPKRFLPLRSTGGQGTGAARASGRPPVGSGQNADLCYVY